jgi:uncharacterized protein (TIGR00251 family)
MTARISVELVATIRVHIIPNAKIDKGVGEYGDAIKIKLRAPAVEGKANAALRCLLAEKLNIPQRAIALEHGQRSRDKVIRIGGLSEEAIRRSLMARTGVEP